MRGAENEANSVVQSRESQAVEDLSLGKEVWEEVDFKLGFKE